MKPTTTLKAKPTPSLAAKALLLPGLASIAAPACAQSLDHALVGAGALLSLINATAPLLGAAAGAVGLVKLRESHMKGAPPNWGPFVAAAAMLCLPFLISTLDLAGGSQMSARLNSAIEQETARAAAAPALSAPAPASESVSGAAVVSASAPELAQLPALPAFDAPLAPSAQALQAPARRRSQAKAWALPDFTDANASAEAALAATQAAAPPPLYWPGEKASAFPRAYYDDESATQSPADQDARRLHARQRIQWLAKEQQASDGPSGGLSRSQR